MIDNSALGIDAAGAGAGVQALLTNAGQVQGAVIAEHTLRLALHQGVTLIGLDALTHGLSTPLLALGIDTTGAGVTRVSRPGRIRNNWRLSASGERVSDGAWRTAADGVMIPDLTNCIDPTGSRTGVNTLLGNAGQTGPAVIILQTLCSAACSRHGVSLVSSDTGADHLATVVLTALGVGATRRGLTRVLDHTASGSERVSSEAGQTPTVLGGASNQTLSILTTRPGLTQGTAPYLQDRHTALDGVDGLGVAGLAGAPLHIVDHHTLGVLAAGVGLAGLDGPHAGDGRGVALIPGQTEAHGPVSDHPTSGVGAALVTPTLGTVIDTSHEGVASLASGTRADGVTVVQLTDGASPAGGGDAGVGGHRDGGAAHVGVTLIAGLTGADRVVVGKLAHSVGAAEAGAHRETLPLESVAVLVLGTVRVLGTI